MFSRRRDAQGFADSRGASSRPCYSGSTVDGLLYDGCRAIDGKRDTSPARRKLHRRYPPKWMKEASAIVIPGLTPKWYRRASYAVVTFR
jgi:hypothetical protein